MDQTVRIKCLGEKLAGGEAIRRGRYRHCRAANRCVLKRNRRHHERMVAHLCVGDLASSRAAEEKRLRIRAAYISETLGLPQNRRLPNRKTSWALSPSWPRVGGVHPVSGAQIVCTICIRRWSP